MMLINMSYTDHIIVLFRMEERMGHLKSFYFPMKTQTFQRIGHRVLQNGQYILVFGGTNSQNEFMSTILRIKTQAMTVDTILTKSQLQLAEFSLFSFKEQVYLWGGVQPSGYINKLFRFTGDDFEVINQSGQLPSPRAYHGSCFISQRYLLIQGGMGQQEFYNDFYILDCFLMQWNKFAVNIEIPFSLSAHLFWNVGRGYLVLGENFDKARQKSVYGYSIYQFKLTDVKLYSLNLKLLRITEGTEKNDECKREASLIMFNYDSPYLMMIGGEVISQTLQIESKPNLNYHNVWIFNLQTLQWASSNLKLSHVGFSFQSVFYQERVYMIGGVSLNSRDFVNVIEVIEIDCDSLQAKLCKICREMYGLKQYNGQFKQFSIKFEHERADRTFLNVKTISKLAKFIKNPFSAIGLLIDNSINLNGTSISIQFKYFDPKVISLSGDGQLSLIQAGNLFQKIGEDSLKMKYNYIKITDDTCGFTQSEIVQCLSSFVLKTETLTTDKKYEQQLQIRRQYGVNIKLGALRLARSCLMVTKTEDDNICVSYFTTNELREGQNFKILNYFISQKQGRSSEYNYQIIRQKVIDYIPGSYQILQQRIKTKIYLFNLERQQLIKQVTDFDSFDIVYKFSGVNVFKNLKNYLQSLYFIPYTGRIIRLQKNIIKFKNYSQIFKKQQQQKILIKLNINLKENYFKQFAFYKYNSLKYPIREIFIYHQNRLLYSIDTKGAFICGFVVIPSTIGVDLCKSKIQSHSDQILFHRFIQGVISNHSRYLPLDYVDPTKKLFRE